MKCKMAYGQVEHATQITFLSYLKVLTAIHHFVQFRNEVIHYCSILCISYILQLT